MRLQRASVKTKAIVISFRVYLDPIKRMLSQGHDQNQKFILKNVPIRCVYCQATPK